MGPISAVFPPFIFVPLLFRSRCVGPLRNLKSSEASSELKSPAGPRKKWTAPQIRNTSARANWVTFVNESRESEKVTTRKPRYSRLPLRRSTVNDWNRNDEDTFERTTLFKWIMKHLNHFLKELIGFAEWWRFSKKQMKIWAADYICFLGTLRY